MHLGCMKYFLAVYFFICYCDSAAQELIPVGSASGHIGLSQVVRSSSPVAKVQVVSVTAVPNGDIGGGKPCGFVYRAKVRQVLKGRDEVNVQFFMSLGTPPSSLHSSILYFGGIEANRMRKICILPCAPHGVVRKMTG